MSKTSTIHTPITDAMVDRACAAGNHGTGRGIMRVMLEAAMNPPPEPEVPVSEAMIDAGLAAYPIEDSRFPRLIRTPWSASMVTLIYRAMERARRAEPPSSENTTQAVYAASNQAQKKAAQAFTICPECGVGSYSGQPSHILACSHA